MTTPPLAIEPADVLAWFLPDRRPVRLEPLTQGNINDTWRIEMGRHQYVILQRLHAKVFSNAAAVMANIRILTEHLSQVNDPDVTFFRLVRNPEGQDHYVDTTGHCWRLLTYIDNSRTLARITTGKQARSIGELLGRFHRLTSALDPRTLADPLPDFHITPRYLEHYDQLSAGWNPTDDREQFCRDFIETVRPTASLLEDSRNRLSHRVIHGDPKAANFLFAQDEDRAISLIDFDTVKPGLLLHDLGDCLRSCCNSRGERQSTPEETDFHPQLFETLMSGYLHHAHDLLTAGDRELLIPATALISFELGLRFFTDHLEGDQYFKTTRRGENLYRALVQFHLHRSISSQQNTLEKQLQCLLSKHDASPT
ncbi:MAG: aminoglycoside phosphotransferase family protein [Desulfobulbus sp.]|nr:aminoglycoside phosphotransferase family protein [Desulfobulbus sp.]